MHVVEWHDGVRRDHHSILNVHKRYHVILEMDNMMYHCMLSQDQKEVYQGGLPRPCYSDQQASWYSSLFSVPQALLMVAIFVHARVIGTLFTGKEYADQLLHVDLIIFVGLYAFRGLAWFLLSRQRHFSLGGTSPATLALNVCLGVGAAIGSMVCGLLFYMYVMNNVFGDMSFAMVHGRPDKFMQMRRCFSA